MRKTITLFFVGLCISLSSFATTYLVQTGVSGGASWSGVSGTVVDLTAAGKSLDAWYGSTVASGDEVWIAAGTYTLTDSIKSIGTEKIYGGFIGTETAITNRAQAVGAKPWEFSNPTIIMGGGTLFRGITMLTGAKLDGITIDACKTTYKGTAGGVTLGHEAAIVQNCIVQNCQATGDGTGGVRISSSAKLLNSYIFNNKNTTKTGGGVQITSLGTVSGCLIDGNYAKTTGAGLYINSTPTETGTIITNNIISNNIADGSGGGISAYATSGKILISNCTISLNSSLGNGGGMSFNCSTISVKNCIIKSNHNADMTGTVANNGSAIYLIYGSAKFNNCIISENVGPTAIGITGGRTATFQNCTVAANTTNWGMEAPINLGVATTSNVFTNCLFYKCSDIPLVTDAPIPPATTITVSPNVSYCGFDDTATPAYTANIGCISTLNDASFKSVEGSDWTLSETSPAIDAGITIAECSTDLVGTTRPRGAAYDMGAYEFLAKNASITIGYSGSTETSVSVAGTVLLDPSFTITASGMYWSATNTIPTDADNTISNGTSSFVSTINGGSANTGYYVKGFLKYTDGVTPKTVYSTPTLVATTPVVPMLADTAGITDNSIRLWWTESELGNQSITYSIDRSLAPDFTTDLLNRTVVDYVNRTYTSLNANTTYYFRVKAMNSTSSSDWSTVKSFTTGATALNSVFISVPVYQHGSIIDIDLASLSGNQTITLFDAQGRNYVNSVFKGGNTVSINKSLNSGVYFLRVQGVDNTSVTKLLVK